VAREVPLRLLEADSDGNPDTAADAGWTPLLATPPYPDYVSGYAGVTSAFTGALADILGTQRLHLHLMSTAVSGTRAYDTGRALREDVIDARVWLGIHFRTTDVAGDAMGRAAAHWALARYLRPLDG
jgi:hypothetical protein